MSDESPAQALRDAHRERIARWLRTAHPNWGIFQPRHYSPPHHAKPQPQDDNPDHIGRVIMPPGSFVDPPPLYPEE